jgi:Holliday junction resolvasome RuvABC endonuclease subunit
MRVLGFDISTVATGWALLEDGRMAQSGVIRPVNELAEARKTTKKAAKESLDELETFRYITAKAGVLIEQIEPDVVVVEDCFMKLNASVLRILARLSGGVLYHWIHKFDKDGTKTHTVMASKARATVGCKGNAKKPEVMAFIKYRYGIDITDDNIADAFILAMYGTIKNGGEAPSEARQTQARKVKRGRRCQRQ